MSYRHGTQYGLASDPGDYWRESATCLGENPELFFAIGKGGLARYQTTQAKAVCSTCPVLSQCAAWVAKHPQEFGVFAGLTEHERRGKAAKPVRPRWCTRCSEPFAWDPKRPAAKLCTRCAWHVTEPVAVAS